MENMWDPDIWMHVLFLAQKCKRQSGITPLLFFVPILLAVIASLKNSSPEKVVAAHNKYCQDQDQANIYLTDPVPLSLGKQVDFSNEDEGASAPALQLSGFKPFPSATVQSPSLTSPSTLVPLEVPPAYPWRDSWVLSWSSNLWYHIRHGTSHSPY